jgi:hypothetical protein
MYIVAIAWLYVALMMAITEKNITAGVLTFVFFGLAPCALVLWLFGMPTRKRNRLREAEQARQAAMREEEEALVQTVAQATAPSSVRMPDENMHEPDRADAQANQQKLRD